MSKRSFVLLVILTLGLAGIACDLSAVLGNSPTPSQGGDLVKTQVAIILTQTAIARPATQVVTKTVAPAATATIVLPAALTNTPAATTGSISGSLTYPASQLPPLMVYALATDNSKSFFVATQSGQNQYTIVNVAPGTYYIVAYPNDYPGVSGGWTPAVACGLSINCTDHSLIPVTVSAGQAVQSINPEDWYAPPGTFPAKPGSTATGSISGALNYPASKLIGQDVYAMATDNSKYFFVVTEDGQANFTIQNIQPGTYYVISYSRFNSSLAAGWTKAVPCGLSANCTDHSLIAVTVAAGQAVQDIQPEDWYAPAGTFPPKPNP